MDEAFIGEIRMIAFGFVPKGWLLCDGSLLPIANYAALFSLLGTTYGGNGQTTFALPDLRGRVPVGAGRGNGLTAIDLGQAAGAESVSLISTNLPPHTHAVAIPAAAAAADVLVPSNTAVLAQGALVGEGNEVNLYTAASKATATLRPFDTGPSPGVGSPLPLRNPYLGINFIICNDGIFPPRQ